MALWLILVCLQLWGRLDLCRAQEDASICRRPPDLENGDAKQAPKLTYRYGDRVGYTCGRHHVMAGGPDRVCIGGEWRGEIRCLKPCTVTAEDMVSHRVALEYPSTSKMYVVHGHWMRFRCAAGTTGTNAGNMRQRCDDGVLHVPTCEDPRS